MNSALILNPFLSSPATKSKYITYFLVLCAGLLGALGFAPFHQPGLIFLSTAVLFYTINAASTAKSAALHGLAYGFSYFSLGVSWVLISIHDYGNLNYFLSGLITLLFIIYLALFPFLVGYFFKLLALPKTGVIIGSPKARRSLAALRMTGSFSGVRPRTFKRREARYLSPVIQQTGNGLLFSILWLVSEYLRATLFTGFPWLLTGTTQIDTPLRTLLPVLGIYGVGLIVTFSSTLLAIAFRARAVVRSIYLVVFTLIILIPSALQTVHWTQRNSTPISVGVIQANLAMRDKWDDHLFWGLLNYYERHIKDLLGKNLIVLPESAIPLPASYLDEYLLKISEQAKARGSALVLGILQPTNETETDFYNSVISLGHAKGMHNKEHLVPFGEYIPAPFRPLMQWLNIPPPNIAPGKKNQSLIKIAQHSVASLICYELAYPRLLRQQMPKAEWIISISDNGWFGHSFASYQQLQMAQVLSLLTGRFQILANNDGLSSIIDDKGEISDRLPPFSSGILESSVYSTSGTTPWIEWGDYPVFIFCTFIFLFLCFLKVNGCQKHLS